MICQMTESGTDMSHLPKNPIQPIVLDEHGVVCFKANKIVDYLLKNGGIDLNRLALLDFTDNDREQFAQLIGYSVSGFGDLPYASAEVYEAASAAAQKLPPQRPSLSFAERRAIAREFISEHGSDLFD